MWVCGIISVLCVELGVVLWVVIVGLVVGFVEVNLVCVEVDWVFESVECYLILG